MANADLSSHADGVTSRDAGARTNQPMRRKAADAACRATIPNCEHVAKVGCCRAIEPKRASVQPKLAVDGLDLGRLDQSRMGHRDREQRSFKLFQPEIEELVEDGEFRAEVVFLPDVSLQQGGMIR